MFFDISIINNTLCNFIRNDQNMIKYQSHFLKISKQYLKTVNMLNFKIFLYHKPFTIAFNTSLIQNNLCEFHTKLKIRKVIF